MSRVEVFEREWTPQQVAFITSPARYTAFIGGVGCGKTSALIRRAIALSQKYPGSVGILFRYTYTEVNSILIPQFFELCPSGLVRKWRRTERELEIWASDRRYSTIYFRNLEKPASYRSFTLTYFGISQAEEPDITIDHWRELCLRLRLGQRQYGFLEGNYSGHNWIWQLFHPEGQARSGAAAEPGFNPADYHLVEADTYSNAKNLSEAYLRDLEAMPEEYKRRYVLGSWDEFGGLVYSEFGAKNICEPFPIPKHWYFYRTIDFGIRNPFVCLYLAVSPSGTVHVFDEYYAVGSIDEHISALKLWESANPGIRFRYTLIDPSAFNREATGISPALILSNAGIPVVRAKNEVGAGITVVKQYLSQNDPTTGKPKLQIFRGRAPNLVREFGEYMWDTLSPARRARRNEPERPRKKGDHCFDGKTEILTPRGWVRFSELRDDDFVVQVTPEGKEEYTRPLRIIRREYTGPMLLLEDHAVDFCVTPEHRMYVARQYQAKFSFVEAKDLPDVSWAPATTGWEREPNLVEIRRTDIREVPFSGMVYCVEVPTGIIFVRRNGKTLVVGNCLDALRYALFSRLPSPPEVTPKDKEKSRMSKIVASELWEVPD